MKRKTNSLFVTNETAVKELFTEVTFNLKADKAKTRYDTLEGKQYLVVPCVMITEGILNGSEGPLYYPAAELSKTPAVWNTKPVVVYHPEMDGQSISACDPVTIEKYSIGQLFNTKWEDGKLKTECWIDEEEANQVDERVLEAVENGSMMEVSTGLFLDNDKIEGEWNGEVFNGTVHNFRPDHLAILPDLIGACSVKDGAGLLRNAQGKSTAEGRLAGSLYKVFNEMSHNELWRKLNDKVETAAMNSWVVDVYDDYFVYEVKDKMYYQEYEIDDKDEVKLIGIRQEVEKIIQYKTTDGNLIGNVSNHVHNKEIDMNKKEKVDALIANDKSPWTEEDREALMAMDEGKLECIVNGSEEKPEPDPEPKVNKGKGKKRKLKKIVKDDEDEDEDETPATNKEMTDEEYIANAPKGVQDMYNFAIATLNKQKAELITKITANGRNPYTPEELAVKNVGELENLAILAEVPAQETPPSVPASPNFGGQAPLPPATNEGDEEKPLIAPPVVNAEKE